METPTAVLTPPMLQAASWTSTPLIWMPWRPAMASSAPKMSTLPARGIEQINQVIATHGVMGYPVAVGMAAGMLKADEKLTAKIRDFVDHHQRAFIEHAATYRATDAEGGSEIAGTARF